ncbi:hypothetical protein BABINDRAFT_99588 [Babjeviella inositovora NRRL Y-12698]|uniref:Uncharacterized protein n=1 Tax=Babjeviella inositovora NRRL Y-12698 TaxID=984486 RepID=A0A1E3QIM4_9ASCO|nr:uncharacterized protein BABINDRAFT_99588 [Babjeviella inositovora NRRL Y-12698]ODQ77545.1 hypothetical protein BABINDRAFT_99588 [Babjeviella inositovora NRRL Y-12698]
MVEAHGIKQTHTVPCYLWELVSPVDLRGDVRDVAFPPSGIFESGKTSSEAGAHLPVGTRCYNTREFRWAVRVQMCWILPDWRRWLWTNRLNLRCRCFPRASV